MPHDDEDELPMLPDDLPRADHFIVQRCGPNDGKPRDHAHIVLYAADETPIAEMSIGPRNVDNIVKLAGAIFAGKRIDKLPN